MAHGVGIEPTKDELTARYNKPTIVSRDQKVVGKLGLEPRRLASEDFKSSVSTIPPYPRGLVFG